MNLDHDFVQMSKLSEEQKKGLYQKWNPFFPQIQVKTEQKKVFTKNGTLFSPNSGKDQKKKVFAKSGTLFSPNSSGHLRSDARQSQIIGGGCRCRPYTQIIGGDTVKLLGGIYPPTPPPPGFGTPGCSSSIRNLKSIASLRKYF